MAKLVLSLLIIGVLTGEAFARFGETPEQCVERYGAAVTIRPQGNSYGPFPFTNPRANLKI
jgi:hypothetical protein